MALPIQAISHATFETPDLVRMVDYYVDVIGLSLAARDGDRAFLYTATGRPAVTLVAGTSPRCSGIAFQIAPGTDFTRTAETLRREFHLLPERRRDSMPGVVEMLSFTDVNGTTIDVLADRPQLPPDGLPRDFVSLQVGARRIQDDGA